MPQLPHPRRRRPRARPRTPHQRFSDRQIVAALKAAKGMAHLAANTLKCHHSTIYERIKSSPAVADALEHERGVRLDVAELKLYEGVLAGEPWAIMFALSHIGKGRGYSTKVELEHDGKVTLELVHEIVTSRADLTSPTGDTDAADRTGAT